MGGGVGVQAGSLNDLVAKTGEGGGRSVSFATVFFGGTINVGDNGGATGGGSGRGGLGLGLVVNSTSNGNTLGTVNLYQPIKDMVNSVVNSAKQLGDQAVRAMNCPNGCQGIP